MTCARKRGALSRARRSCFVVRSMVSVPSATRRSQPCNVAAAPGPILATSRFRAAGASLPRATGPWTSVSPSERRLQAQCRRSRHDPQPIRDTPCRDATETRRRGELW